MRSCLSVCPTALCDSNVRALPYAQLSGFASCLNSGKISAFGSFQCGTLLVVSPVSIWERDGAYGHITISKELDNAPHNFRVQLLGKRSPMFLGPCTTAVGSVGDAMILMWKCYVAGFCECLFICCKL